MCNFMYLLCMCRPRCRHSAAAAEAAAEVAVAAEGPAAAADGARQRTMDSCSEPQLWHPARKIITSSGQVAPHESQRQRRPGTADGDGDLPSPPREGAHANSMKIEVL